jgi:hypothetical protein
MTELAAGRRDGRRAACLHRKFLYPHAGIQRQMFLLEAK